MKILVIGGHGMAGHLIADYFKQATDHEIWCTARRGTNERGYVPLDVTNESDVSALLHQIRPDIVINAVALLNMNAELRLAEAIYVNSLFPHRLVEYGRRLGFRLIHLSTDCVFSGSRGNYTETDITDGTTVYAKTKSLGEVIDDANLTIRTSIVGPELKPDGIGLLHWFLGQTGTIQGYRHVFWNGVTTLQLAKTIEWTLHRPINGLVHLTAPGKVSKYALLTLFQEAFGRSEVVIQPYDGIMSDKSLVNTRSDFPVKVPDYAAMLHELKTWMTVSGKRIYSYKV